jgi:hypothetical protein
VVGRPEGWAVRIEHETQFARVEASPREDGNADQEADYEYEEEASLHLKPPDTPD